MKKKAIAIVIILLVFLFPFRMAFLQCTGPVMVDGKLVDAGRVPNLFYFLLTVFGFLAFFFMSVTDGTAHKEGK